MIITGPTGSYATVLPKSPSDPTSVVYTISSGIPPRPELHFIQLPTGLERMQRDGRVIPDNVRRDSLGALVFVSKDNQPGQVPTGNQLFFFGQVVEFSDIEQTAVNVVNSSIETEHNQYYANLDSVGLSSDEFSGISEDAVAAQKQILAELEGLQKQKSDLEVDIVSQQKIISEASKVLSGLEVILYTDPNNQKITNAIAEVQAKQQLAESELVALVDALNAIPDAVHQKHDQLRALAALID